MTPSKVSLVKELERLFNASERAMACALSHGQVTVDGYKVGLDDDRRWTKRQLSGRMAVIHRRSARLFGGSQRANDTIQVVVNEAVPDGMVVGGRDGDE